MHLSDPWAGSPYRSKLQSHRETDQILERACITEADAVSVTTKQQAEILRLKYPQSATKIFICPNVMPPRTQQGEVKDRQEKVRFVYTGAFYGARRPTVLLKSLEQVERTRPDLACKVCVELVGNMQADIAAEIASYNLMSVKTHASVDFASARQFAINADMVLSIEPDGEDPHFKSFLPSKVLDYIQWGCPILAITPQHSPTWDLCEQGYGWSVKPDDPDGLTTLIMSLIETPREKLTANLPSPPMEYCAYNATRKLVDVFNLIRATFHA
jgi:glycosyltransferase involved in cell wall biosynthesis